MTAASVSKQNGKHGTGRSAWPKNVLGGSLRLSKSRKDGLTHDQELLGLFVAQQSNLSLAMPALAVLMAMASLMWSPVTSVAYWLGTVPAKMMGRKWADTTRRTEVTTISVATMNARCTSLAGSQKANNKEHQASA